jgi:ATP-dependent exoDNAse (exonuclease V) beta subunit
VLDLAFEDADGWTVVDFKTDAEIGAELSRYRPQVGPSRGRPERT